MRTIKCLGVFSFLVIAAISLAQTTPCGGLLANVERQGGGTNPPTSITNVEQISGWGSCDNFDCSGGHGTLGSCWIEQYQKHPSLSGGSAEIYAYTSLEDALFHKKLDTDGDGKYDGVTSLTFDFHFMIDSAATTASQALEFDVFQFGPNLYRYMMGTECNITNGTWDLWNQVLNNGKGDWEHQDPRGPLGPCTNTTFAPGIWHHIIWKTSMDHNTNQYTFQTVDIDDDANPQPIKVCKTYTATQTQQVPDNLGVQFQIDVNSTGYGYHEWFDGVTLTTSSNASCP